MGLSDLSEADLAAWVKRSCQAQGIQAKVTDPLVLRDVSVLLGTQSGASPAQPRSGSRRAAGADSQTPHRLHTVGVQGAGSVLAWSDHSVVQHGADDCTLTGQVQVRPLSA